MARSDTDSMNRLLALTILLTSCAPVHDLLHPQKGPIAYDAPVRLFNDDVATPCGRPHPGWTPALRQRMARERMWSSYPTQTPMDYEGSRFNAAFRVPTGIERDVLLWKPKTP